MTPTDDIDHADRLAKRRALTCLALAVVLFSSQAASLDLAPDRPFPPLYSEAFYLWAATLLLLLVLATGLFRGPSVRALLNDEATLQHRLRALAVGFWAAITASAILWAIAEPITAMEASRITVSIAVSAALLRFGWLEWKSLK